MPIVATAVMSPETTTCHQANWPRAKSTGMTNGAVGGR